MSSEGLRKAVLDRARAEAEQLLAQSKKRGDEARAAAAERAGREAADRVEQAKRRAADTRARERSSLERSMRLAALEEKNQLVERVFEETAKRFKALPPDERGQLYARELDGVELGGATLRVARGGASMFGAFAARGVKVEEDDSIDAGYVVVRDDFRLDRTLASRLSELRASARGDVAGILFEGSE